MTFWLCTGPWQEEAAEGDLGCYPREQGGEEREWAGEAQGGHQQEFPHGKGGHRGCPGRFGVQGMTGSELLIRHSLELMILEGFSSLSNSRILWSTKYKMTVSSSQTCQVPTAPSSQQKPQDFPLKSLSMVCFWSQLVLHTSPADLSILFWLSTSTTELNFGGQGICIVSAEISGCSISLLLVCLGLARHCWDHHIYISQPGQLLVLNKKKKPGELQPAVSSPLKSTLCLRGSFEEDHCKEVLQLLKKFSTARKS